MNTRQELLCSVSCKASCLSLPLFHASVGMEMIGDRVGSGRRARCCSPVTARCITHRQHLPHGPLLFMARNAPGSAAEAAPAPAQIRPSRNFSPNPSPPPSQGGGTPVGDSVGVTVKVPADTVIKCGQWQRSVT